METKNNNESTSKRIPFGKFIYRIDVKASMDDMKVDDEIRFNCKHVAYGNVYTTANRIKEESGKTFSVTLKYEEGYTLVKRIS